MAITSTLLNEAVQFCTAAYNKAHSAARDAKEKDYECVKKANRAYKLAMPRLTNYANMRSFITCVTYGMIIEVFQYDEGSKLLYAAQIALRSLSHEAQEDRDGRPPGRPGPTDSDTEPAPAAAPADTPTPTPTADPAITPAAAAINSKPRCRSDHHPQTVYQFANMPPASSSTRRQQDSDLTSNPPQAVKPQMPPRLRRQTPIRQSARQASQRAKAAAGTESTRSRQIQSAQHLLR